MDTASSLDLDLPLVIVRLVPGEGFGEHLRALNEMRVETALIVTYPGCPCWTLRLMALLTRPSRLLILNENQDYFEVRIRAWRTIVRHCRWRVREWLDRRRRSIPKPFERLRVLRIRAIGWWLALNKQSRQRAGEPLDPAPTSSRPRGVSVVIPSRNGKEMLARILPLVIADLSAGEVIVIDNGSTDATADFLRTEFPDVILVEYATALGFPVAINIGIHCASFSHICLLNNDMAIAPGFFGHLLDAFNQVPGLFAANPQVFLPPGAPRQETGKAVITADPAPFEFPVRCEPPLPGEDLSYVLYGSSGCSLFDADRLLSLGGVDEVYHPAYVEDLDVGVRAWQRGWPTVLAAHAHVVHEHRATMSRLYSPEQLQRMVVEHWMMFLARTVRDRSVFLHYWRHAATRLSNGAISGSEHWRQRKERAVMPDAAIFALCDGSVSVFPGAHAHNDRPQAVLFVTLGLPSPRDGSRELMRRASDNARTVLVSVVDRTEPPAPELLAVTAEIVTIQHRAFESQSVLAALSQTIAKWNPKIAVVAPEAWLLEPELARRLHRVVAIPPCVDLHYFQPVPNAGESGRVLFTTPLPSMARRSEIGCYSKNLAQVHMPVDSDVRRDYRRAQVVIIDAPSKALLEAMAMGKAIIASSKAVAGMDLISGDGLFVADATDEIAAIILHLIRDETLRRRLEHRARQIAETRFGCEEAAHRLDALYLEMLAHMPTR